MNRFVKLLVDTLDEAASEVHQTNIKIRAPKKIPTPYGGRLIWTLPGKTKMIAHLKDKMKIRHRKRWSQVMYMYYLLGHKLMELPISVDRKAVIAENTYLLTLDGDIDFQPSAVTLLIDLMKKNKNLGKRLLYVLQRNVNAINYFNTRCRLWTYSSCGIWTYGMVPRIRIRYWALATKSYRTYDWMCTL